jgi:hypothetical protein
VICAGVAGSASSAASQRPKLRSALVVPATAAGERVTLVIRQRAHRFPSARSQAGSMSVK